MGRAAAVRAATKSKTDAKKAKVNGLYGKKIIMAVKEGGSPDPGKRKFEARYNVANFGSKSFLS